ncbi:MAG: hypothetical protein AAF242_17220 [Bacteroidota bacterium]
MSKYVPINCNYYDELEAIATLRKKVEVEYYEQDQPTTIQNVMIKDLYTKNKEEFVVFDNGLILRLDYLIKVDGKPVILAC